MFPTLFDTASLGATGELAFTVPTYFVMIMLGFGLGVYLTYQDAIKLGIDRQKFLDFSIWMLIVGVLGSRFMHVLVDGFFMDYVHLCIDPFLVDGKPLTSGTGCVSNAECLAQQNRGYDIGSVCGVETGLCYPQQDCFRGLKFWAGGLTVYGGLIACVVFAYFYMKRFNFPVRKVMDLGGYAVPLGICLGRIGCLAAGCCYGGVCDIDGLGIQFPTGTLAYQEHFDHFHEALNAQWRAGEKSSLPVWPTQLISSLYTFGIFLFAYFWVRTRKRFDGQVLLTTVFLYALFRFGIEFLRADPRGAALGVSTSQWVALGTSVLAAFVFYKLRKESLENRAESSEDSDAR